MPVADQIHQVMNGDQDQQRAVRDVDDVHDAEDQRQPARHQGVDAADQQPEHECLHQLGHAFLFRSSGRGPGSRWPVRRTGHRAVAHCQGVLATTVSTVAASFGATISDRAALPLAEQELLRRRTRLVPASGPRMRLHLVARAASRPACPGRATADLLDRRLQDLRRGEGVRGVLGRDRRRRTAWRTRPDELVVLRRLRLLVPADRVEDALGVLRRRCRRCTGRRCSAPRSGTASSASSSSCLSDRTRPTPSSKTAPWAIRSGFFAAIALAIVWKFVASAG